MEISIEDLLKNIAKSDDIIKREELNKELYQKTLLNKINEELKPLKYFTEVVNTPSKFIEYAKECSVRDVTVSTQHIEGYIYCAYVFLSKDKLYRIDLPLKYGNIEELTSRLFGGKNYSKVRLYQIDGCRHKILGHFNDVKQALQSIGGK